GYHVPQTNNSDFYALNLLRTALYHGESSRMYRRLVDQDQIALDVSAFVEPAFDPTLEVIVAQPKQNVDSQKVEKAMYEEIDLVKNAFISDQELEKAKNVRLVEFYTQMQAINGMTNNIGTYELFFSDYLILFDAFMDFEFVHKAE